MGYGLKNINLERIYKEIENDWKRWAIRTNATKMVIGISGGKDSSVVAALAARIFGKHNVWGVLMPQGVQEDFADAEQVIEVTGINSVTINIEDAVNSITSAMRANSLESNSVVRSNLPARVRMSTLFAVAQSVGGRAINTCNLSENVLGWATIFGDSAGLYAPLKDLTCTEVKALGKWLGLPQNLYDKVPADGLCGKTDEEAFGMTYDVVDAYIRTGEAPDFDTEKKILDMYNKSKFKEEIIHIPGPAINASNYVEHYSYKEMPF